MPSQAEVKWSQLKVGLIVIASLALLSVLLLFMSSAAGFSLFQKQLTARAYFNDAEGLKAGAAVNLDGVPVGEVRKVQIVTDPARRSVPVLVILRLSPKYRHSLKTDTKATLSTVGVLGDTVVQLASQAATGPEMPDGAELATANEPSINDVVKSSQGTVQSLNVILDKLNHTVDGLQAGQGTVGQLLTNRELYDSANRTINQLNTLTGNINHGRGTVGKLLSDESLYNKLNDTATKLDQVATNLSGGKGSAGKLLTDETLYDNLNTTLTNTNALLKGVNAGQGSLGMLMKDPTFANKLNDTVDKLDLLLGNVNSGKGTLGKLATDDQAYKSLNKLLNESTTLVTLIRQDPKKYFVIRLKLF